MTRDGRRLRRVLVVLSLVLIACGDTSDGIEPGPWASEIERFEPGDGAGFGASGLPDVALGPPEGHGVLQGSIDVLSLGAAGVIVLGFTPHEIVDGPGPDFVVFENPFWPDGDAEEVWAELGEVSVSEDGESWTTFPCDPSSADWSGCAGWTPTESFDGDTLEAVDPELTGGDAFDLAEIGVDRARYVRIRDLEARGASPSRGFDLDAVGLVHFADADDRD